MGSECRVGSGQVNEPCGQPWGVERVTVNVCVGSTGSVNVITGTTGNNKTGLCGVMGARGVPWSGNV